MVGKDSVFNYNFASPNTITSKESIITDPDAYNPSNAHSNQFNICRSTDQVPQLPGIESSMLLEAKELMQYGWDPLQCFHRKHDYYWGRWGITKWFSDGIALPWEAHDMWNYFNYVSQSDPVYSSGITSGDVRTLVKNAKFIFCPVDATVKDRDGKVIAAVINNEPVYYGDSFGTVVISTAGDLKCISYSADSGYAINMTATDYGTMSYVAAKGSSIDEEYSDIKEYRDIYIYTGKRMLEDNSGEGIDDVRLYTVDDENRIVYEIMSDGSEMFLDNEASDDHSDSAEADLHDYEDGHSHILQQETYRKASETAKGLMISRCTICGFTETRELPMLSPTLKAVKIVKPKSLRKSAAIKWKKLSKKNLRKTKKIQIQYSTDKSFRKGVKTKYANAKTTSYKIKGLKSKKRYYVRIRAYTKKGRTVHVSKWSAVRAVRIR